MHVCLCGECCYTVCVLVSARAQSNLILASESNSNPTRGAAEAVCCIQEVYLSTVLFNRMIDS